MISSVFSEEDNDFVFKGSIALNKRRIPFPETLIPIVSTSSHDFFITGGCKTHVDDPSDSNPSQFLSFLDHTNLIQHVNFPAHQRSRTLD